MHSFIIKVNITFTASLCKFQAQIRFITLYDVMFGLLVRLPNGFEEEIFVFCIFGSLFLQQHASSNKGWLASPFPMYPTKF